MQNSEMLLNLVSDKKFESTKLQTQSCLDAHKNDNKRWPFKRLALLQHKLVTRRGPITGFVMVPLPVS